jgi:DNA helicase II / ATP-dependent DNA helicase PcrA
LLLKVLLSSVITMFDTLNAQQKEAVLHTEGPLLVFAGAGSGKTKVIISRIVNLIHNHKVSPTSILAVTFTNKAAGEMKERIQKALEEGQIKTQTLPWLGTFHSFGVYLMRMYGELIGLGKNFTIFDSDDQESVVKEILKDMLLDAKEYRPSAILNVISGAKREFIMEDEFPKYAQGYFQEVAADVYKRYQKRLKEQNAVDFDDLLLLPLVLFEKHPDVLERLQEKYQYILVDEYQDTNQIQYQLIKQLAKKYKNVCVVGDDDQSIYSWRGATVKNILRFHEDYPDLKVVKLEQNYRSTKNILDAAYGVISKNTQRTDKKLWTEVEGGDKIRLYTASDEQDEADYVVDWLMAEGRAEHDKTAILYRTNAQSRTMEEALIRAGISYRLVGGVRFYDRKEIRDLMAYLKILYNQKDDVSLKRIINVPTRKVGPKAIADLEKAAKSAKMGLVEYLLAADDVSLAPSIKTFREMLSLFIDLSKKLKVRELLEKLIDQIGYIQYIDDNSDEALARIENIKELISVTAKFGELDPEESLRQFLEEVALVEQESQKVRDGEGAVTLMTLHAAKGLEFDNVFMVGMEEGLFPHSNSFIDTEQLSEERRLCYVGITRARRKLFLTNAEKRFFFGRSSSNIISRFIEDIPKALLYQETWNGGYFVPVETSEETDSSSVQYGEKYKSGDIVQHDKFGQGRVIAVDGPYITISFPGQGTKKLSLDFVDLEKIEVEDFS